MELPEVHTKKAPATPGPDRHDGDRQDDHALARAFDAARDIATRRLGIMEELEQAYDARDTDSMRDAVRRLLGREVPSA